MKSAIYEGTVQHRRSSPLEHEFAYRLFMLYIDLEELPALFEGRWLWSAGRFAPAWFRRGDFFGADSGLSLDEALRRRIQEECGQRPLGRIRMLTHLRYWGWSFNPVTFYYVFDEADEALDYVVAEITNTPWGERHAYVLNYALPQESTSRAQVPEFRFEKTFHVSPFMPMDLQYRWRFQAPAEDLGVTMVNEKEGEPFFSATLNMKRRPWNGANLARVFARHPFMTLKVSLGIYWQALRLKWKKAPFHDHVPQPATRSLGSG